MLWSKSFNPILFAMWGLMELNGLLLFLKHREELTINNEKRNNYDNAEHRKKT